MLEISDRNCFSGIKIRQRFVADQLFLKEELCQVRPNWGGGIGRACPGREEFLFSELFIFCQTMGSASKLHKRNLAENKSMLAV